MAEETLVDRKVEDGQKLIQELRCKGFDVSVAGWVQEESGLWYLYLGSKIVDDKGSFDAYKVLNQVLRQINNCGIDPFEIKLIGTEHPLSKEILDLHHRYPAPLHTLYRLHELGGMRIGEAHIYPPVTVR